MIYVFLEIQQASREGHEWGKNGLCKVQQIPSSWRLPQSGDRLVLCSLKPCGCVSCGLQDWEGLAAQGAWSFLYPGTSVCASRDAYGFTLSLELFPQDSDPLSTDSSLSILVSMKQAVSAWISLLSLTNRECSQRIHGWTCGALTSSSQRNLLSFILVPILVSSDRLHLCFFNCHRDMGVAVNQCQSFIAWNFQKDSLPISHILYLSSENNSKSEAIGGSNWLPVISTLLIVVALLQCVFFSIFFFIKMWSLFTFPFSPGCVRSLLPTKDSLAAHFCSF